VFVPGESVTSDDARRLIKIIAERTSDAARKALDGLAERRSGASKAVREAARAALGTPS